MMVVGGGPDHNILWLGWRGRIRTFDLLIQRTPNDLVVGGAI